MSTIVLLTANCLCNNPRVVKEATALAQAGHDVSVLGAWFAPDLKVRDRRILKRALFDFDPVFDGTLAGRCDTTTHVLRRARSKAANVIHALTGWESPHQLGAATAKLFARARGVSADLFIAHSEPALYVTWRLMQAGRLVGVDMEDWYSEDLLPEDRKHRPLGLLHQLEQELLVAGAYASCPSRAMSDALAAEYGCRQPAVVYNSFPLAERQTIDGLRKVRRDASVISVFWYSQTIGSGRGLEDLFAALPLLDRDVEVHLCGHAAPGMEQFLRSHIPDRQQSFVFFHPQVPNEELLSRIAEHDIGFAGELKYCRNKEVTVSNKMLHYLLAGLAVVASDTAGQREVAASAPGAVELYQPGNPPALAKALNLLLNSPERLAGAKAASLQAAERTFCWEKQEGVLLNAVAAALQ